MDPQSNQEPQQPTDETPQGALPPSQGPNQQQSDTSASATVEPQAVQPTYTPPAAEPQQPVAGLGNGLAQASGPQPNKGKMWLIIVLIIIVLASAGIGAYFVFFRNTTTANQAASQSSSAAESGAIDLATLDKVVIGIPDSLAGYNETDTGYDTVKDYISADGTCELMLGTASAAELPGEDLDAIIEPQMEQLRSAGATVNGPTVGTALIVKDSADENVLYSLPTINFELVQDSSHVLAHYSAVILKGGDRVIVNRICTNASGSVDENLLTAVDEAAKNIVVTKQ